MSKTIMLMGRKFLYARTLWVGEKIGIIMMVILLVLWEVPILALIIENLNGVVVDGVRMSADFQTLWGEVLQTFPNLSSFLAKRFVQRSVLDIYNSHQWSFLNAEGVLFSPSIISTGTFSIIKFSNTITANSAAILTLDNLSNPILTQRQIRFSTELYNIISVDASFSSNGLLTLDRPVLESTSTSQTYQVYRCYYGPPLLGINGVETTDFLRYNSIYNPAISSWFTGLIPTPSELLNNRDPQRTSFGIPFKLYTHAATSTGTPQFEMWPHPLSSAAYITSYQRLGMVPTLPTDVLPLLINDDLVLQKAFWYGCMWAYKNQVRYDDLKGVNWLLAAAQHNKEYSNLSSASPGILERTQIQDGESYPVDLITDERSFGNFAVGTDEMSGFYSIDPNP